MAVLPPDLEEPPQYGENYVLYWNRAGLELNRLTHSLRGPQSGPPLSARALGILHLAVHDAYFAVTPTPGVSTYLRDPADAAYPDPAYHLPDPAGVTDARQAVAGAAVTVLDAFYGLRNTGPEFAFAVRDQLDQLVKQLTAGFAGLDALSSGYQYGEEVGTAVLHLLAVKPDEPGADQGAYRPKPGRYFFRDEPTHPVRLLPVDPNNPAGPKRAVRVYHAPFYGMTATRVAVQMTAGGAPAKHMVADPPKNTPVPAAPPGNFGVFDPAEYEDAVRDVVRMGGAPLLNSTLRTPDQTAAGHFWAYDGTNLIGTPPRLYNQIFRRIAWDKRPDTSDPAAEANNADFARLFALANAALTDAGIFCWREKYCFEFWRPLSGVREHDPATGPHDPANGPPDADPGSNPLVADADPFWLTLGAPDTNSNETSFKPPFPAYPSGHATFGAAGFHALRLYYRARDGASWPVDGADDIRFDFVSDELNGVNRELRQPYDPAQPITEQPGVVRTRVVRHYPSLWAAIFENALSRVWLGVHWRFDAFSAADTLVGSGPPYDTDAAGRTLYKDPAAVTYGTTGTRVDSPGEDFPVGGVPLGLGIATDIFEGGLKPTPPGLQPTGRSKCGLGDPSAAANKAAKPGPGPRPRSVTPKSTPSNVR